MSGKKTMHQIAAVPSDAGLASKDLKLCNLVAELRESLLSIKQNYLKIGWTLRYIKEKKLYEEEGFHNINEFASHYFGLSQSAVSRFIRICKEFTVGDRPELMQRYRSYNLSQLEELLPLGEELRDQVTPEMTVTQIRDFKKAEAKKDKKRAAENKQDLDRTDTNESNAKSPCSYILPKVEKEWQIDLPRFRNDDERIAWLYNIESWGFWYVDPNIQTEYFKYDFGDGSRLIATKYKDIVDGRIDSGDIHYHMAFSDSFLEKHQDECLAGYKNHSIYDGTPVELIVRFLDELQSGEPEAATMEGGSAGSGEEQAECNEYTPNRFVLDDFDLERKEGAESFVGKKCGEFYDENGYIPKWFNAKHRTEITEFAQTLTTGSGTSVSGMGSIVFFDAAKEAAAAINNEDLDKESACRMIDKIVRVAKPEEKEKVEELLGIKYPSVGKL